MSSSKYQHQAKHLQTGTQGITFMCQGEISNINYHVSGGNIKYLTIMCQGEISNYEVSGGNTCNFVGKVVVIYTSALVAAGNNSITL